ncbi:MAG: hypothetical protein VX000_02820, partial [Myxococcota bacterium]|nr:hypothetical protein [Myxococcota bacterium]
MGSCPFCGGDVSEDVLLYGGRCPHCLIQIPGEETPTDPGEQAQATQQAAEAAARGRGSGAGIAVAAVVLLGLGFGAWFATRPTPPVADDAFMDDSDDFAFAPASAHQDLPVAPSPDAPIVDGAAADGGPARTRSRGASGGASGGPARVSTTPPTGGSIARKAEAAAPARGGMVPTVTTPGPSLSGASPPVAANPLGAFDMASGPASRGPQAIVLEKPGEIYDMVKKVLRVNGNQMKQCYEQRLKVQSDLRG